MSGKKSLCFFLCVMMLIGLCGCNSNQKNTESQESVSVSTESVDPIEKARNEVIAKWESEADAYGTVKFIEDVYKEYPNDEVISNIYFYSEAKQQYDHFVELDKDRYLELAKEYAAKIDPDYSGVFSDEISEFTSTLIPDEELEAEHDEASVQEDKYNSLTNDDKKEICDYIQSRYDYYDELNNGYAGDKYSDIIMQEASAKYGLSTSQIEIIWMKMYSY